MYWTKNPAPIQLKDRLNKLEEELDQLICVQERIKEQPRVNLGPAAIGQVRYVRHQQCACVNMACTKTLVTQCSAPLADITKFLQHINFNLSKGTQAISKIANSNLQKKINDENRNYHGNCAKKEGNPHGVLATNSIGKKVNEDALYKELREEKDKRMRAENQLKHMKDELKKTKCELQRSANETLQELQKKFKDALEKLEMAKNELEKREQELLRNESLWPHKYETVCNKLQEEQVKNYEAERNVRELQETLKKIYINTKEHLKLQETSSWLKEQNESLICLSKKLKAEVEDKNAEIMRKSGIIDQNLLQIKHLTSLCEKLRDFLIILRQKNLASEKRSKLSQIRNQNLTDKLLEAQSTSDYLKKQQLRDRFEHQRLSELFKSVNVTNDALQKRVDEMSEIMKQQNYLIVQQSNTITIKEEELNLALKNGNQCNKRLEVERSKAKASDQKSENELKNEIERLDLELKTQKENIFIKEKMVESNLETISQLKTTLARKVEDLNYKKRELAERDQKLAIEQTNNEQLQSKLKSLLNCKEELRIKVEELEEELENQVSSEHSNRLEQIEKQVIEKQQEWEELKANLVQEKINALQSLKHSEEQLSSKKKEYEIKLAVHEQKVNELMNEVTNKKTQLKEATEDIKKLKTELQETAERAEKTKKGFEDKLRSACETWQKTMQLLQN